MSCSKADLHVAKTKMKLKNANHCLSFVTTLWKGEIIMCVFNNLQNEISTIYCNQIFDTDEFQELESMISEFIFG
jgi:hypothetical protein